MSGNPKPETCPHNEWVMCYHTADCEACGWNPDVAEERTKAIREEMGIEE